MTHSDKMLKIIGYNLKALRKQYGVTQKDLTKELGISLRSYINYESGKNPISFKTAMSLCDYYGIELTVLLSDYYKQYLKQEWC